MDYQTPVMLAPNQPYAYGVSGDVRSIDKIAYHKHLISFLKRKPKLSKDALFVINKAEIRYRNQLINRFLPSCQHYFSVNTCPQKVVIDELAKMNAKFNVSTIEEIKLLRKLNIDLSTCFYSSPIKNSEEIDYANKNGITRFVIDNESELEEYAHLKNQVKLLFRVSFSNKINPGIKGTQKIGIESGKALPFIIKASSMGYNISGISFHSESPMNSNLQILKALQHCRIIFDEASEVGIKLSVLDIGDGFPFSNSHNYETMHNFFDPINTYLNTRFKGVELMTEVGRFISTPIAVLVCKIIEKTYQNGKICYYLNDGIYHCLKDKMKEINNFTEVSAYSKTGRKIGEEYLSMVYGSTNDFLDLLMDDVYLPELNIGDHLLFDNVGAYGLSCESDLNKYDSSQVIILDYC